MTSRVIPDEAIEAAAEALVGSTLGDRSGINWEEFYEAARLALEAAAPHMLRELRELMEDMEAQPPSEIGSVRGMGDIIRATMKGML